jgi:translation initiation factor 2B subunit (eIF-2B alpha/beta/delta family)
LLFDSRIRFFFIRLFPISHVTSSFKTVKLLLSKGIQVTVIPDSSVAHIMSEVDIVLVGAFAVVESGGILNQV